MRPWATGHFQTLWSVPAALRRLTTSAPMATTSASAIIQTRPMAVVAIRRMRRMAAEYIQGRPAQRGGLSAPQGNEAIRILLELQPAFWLDRDGARLFSDAPQARSPVGWDVRQRWGYRKWWTGLGCLTLQ